MSLREYQLELKRGVYEAWAAGAQAVMGVMPTGSGKTMTFTNIMSEHRGASIALAHRSELVSQMSLALARHGLRHRVIGSSSTAKNCRTVNMNELGKNFVDPHARIAAASVQTLVRRDPNEAWMKEVTLVVVDECFPAGTMVSGRPIETLQIGDLVEAFDEHTGEIKMRPVTRLFRNVAPESMVSIRARHHVLDCTFGHPFYTKNGWKPASDLTVDDEVLQYEMRPALHMVRKNNRRVKRTAEVLLSKKGSHFLRKKMRTGVSGIETHLGLESSASTAAHRHLHGVLEHGRSFGVQAPAVEEDREGVLLDGMLERVSSPSFIGNHVSNEQKIRIGENAAEKPHVVVRNKKESERVLEKRRPSTERARGKWPRANATRIDSVRAAASCRIRNAARDTNETASRVGVPNVLQTRSRKLGAKDSSRGRRTEPYRSEAYRCEERRVLEWVRVDRVEIFKSENRYGTLRGTGDGHVYNIEVADFHTYIANGVVVHNCHHLLSDNAWGKALVMFPNARVLGVTATPMRADGKGLGRHADGLIDVMIEGPSMRSLIEAGHLTDYRLICPPSDIDLSSVPISAGGDYSPKPLSAAVHASHVVGDVVQHYIKFAAGKLGVTFATDVESARDIAAAYRAAGVPAEVISADTPDVLRAHLMHRFRARELLQLVNVDLLGEGVDVPAIEVVSMARPTQSLGLYMQQVGRALRPMAGKDKAIILDHVGNWTRHGLVDKHRVWTLDRRERKSRSTPDDVVPIRVCVKCLSAYERVLSACPFCGEPHVPATRGTPEAVEGDLREMAPELLARLRGEVSAVGMAPKIPYGATPVVAGSIRKNHRLRIEALGSLGLAMAVWGGWREMEGDDVPMQQRRFFHQFGHDVLSAQALGRADAEALEGKIRDVLTRANIIVDGSVSVG